MTLHDCNHANGPDASPAKQTKITSDQALDAVRPAIFNTPDQQHFQDFIETIDELSQLVGMRRPTRETDEISS